MGEAYFLRGLYLFHAVNMFKNVPVPTQIAAIYPQKTEAEGWAQVIADFKSAAEFLPVSYSNANDKGIWSKRKIGGLLT